MDVDAVRAGAPRALRRLPELDASERPPLHRASSTRCPGSRARTTSPCSTSPRACSSRGRATSRSGRYRGTSLIAAMVGNEDGRLRRDRQLLDQRRQPRASSRRTCPGSGWSSRRSIEGDAFQVIPGGALGEDASPSTTTTTAHAYEQQLDGLRMIEPWLADRALLIVDDTDWERGRARDARLPRAAAARAPARLDPRQGQQAIRRGGRA